MAALNHVLQSIITRKNEFCCLCLKVIKENSVTVQDEVILKEDDKDCAIKIFDVLTFILGSETCNNISAFEFLCKQCTHSAVTCYKFITTCKGNFEVLSKALCSLNSCFDSIAENNYKCNALYVTLDSNNYSTQQYYDDNHPISSTTNAFKRFQCIIDNHSSFNINTEMPIKKESITMPEPTQKRKRRDYFSVPIKTCEMLYDKNDRTNLKCKVCFKLYPSLSNLRNHFIRVHAPKDYQCSICNRKFGSIALVEAHKSESHCTLICIECGKTFHNRHTLKMHEISHHLKLVCQDCGRIYRSQTTFKKHIELNICGQNTRASPADAKFTCDYCNKKYTQKVSLRVHIQHEHGNYKGHECKWCKKKFWAKSRLNAHIVKHTQEKKFQCTTCGGKFVSKESLLYHTRTHTGEKPYKCRFCDSKFLSASRRADHTKRHHSEVIYKCDVCNVKYTTQICLDKHKKTHEKSNKRLQLSEEDNIFLEMSDEEEYNLTQHIS
ncbi:zinc finger protein 816-like [Vanessa atalanta]|uniref:zinc finger protein 816-like n=1 Tax=Vanessa atalanta TaxID=42275 RepID=UPI001FCD00CC|nr:zinc finger protein 816-like [Vanessa atalanta]